MTKMRPCSANALTGRFPMCIFSYYVIFSVTASAISLCLVLPVALYYLGRVYFEKLNADED